MSLKLIVSCVLYWCKGLFENPVELFKVLGVERDDKVLEIGCAIGYHTFPLAKIASGGRIYAVDISEEGIAYLKRKIGPGENIEPICCSAEAVELPSSSLDKVICFDTLHDVPNFELTVERWVEFLREGQKLLFRDPIISFERIQTISKDKLHHAVIIKGVHIFIRR